MEKILSKDDPLGKSFEFGGHIFPGIWRYIFPQEFQALKLPKESFSSCMNCPKACYESYRQDYRCCTYHPRVPNFLLGLAIDEGRAKERIQRLLRSNWITPEGLTGTPKQWIDYLWDLKEENFGKSQKVLCPMIEEDSGLCSIHAFRNSVCSTFFCLKDYADRSDRFWEKLQALGSQVEMLLCQWALKEIGFDLEAYIARVNSLSEHMHSVSDEKNKGLWNSEYLDYLWADWAHRKEELLLETARLVSDNRQWLWEIANSGGILEADVFDKAMMQTVPEQLQDQLDEDLGESNEVDMLAPRELWAKLWTSYQKLHQLRFGKYKLSKRIFIKENNRQTQEENFYANYSHIIEIRESANRSKVESREYIDEKDRSLLELFIEAREINVRFFKEEIVKKHSDPGSFLIKMQAKRILIAER